MVSIHQSEKTQTSTVEAWIMEHGGAAAIGGCMLFWLTLGVTVYFAL